MLKRLDDSLKLPRLTNDDWIEGRIVMFTIDQIDDLHGRLGSAKTLPEYVRALKALGVERTSPI